MLSRIWNFEFINNKKTRTIVNFIFKIVLYYAIDSIVSVGTKIVESIIRGEHGAPSFVTPAFAAFGAGRELLFVVAFLLLVDCIPYKNRVVKGILFSFLFWTTDYLPQIFAMFGAYSPIINPKALSFTTILADSFGYLISGILMGLILSPKDTCEKRTLSASQYAKSILASAASFAVVLAILELMVFLINPAYSIRQLFQIAPAEAFQYYLVFYVFQAVSGGMFAVYYRLTEFNAKRKLGWFRFAIIHGAMIWSPIILIMAFFGLSVSGTLLYEVLMMIALIISHYVLGKIMN